MHILITGASAGIGEALTRHFAKIGWNLSLVARNGKRLHEIVNEFDVHTCIHQVDLSSYKKCSEIVKISEEKLGHIDLLINNAGILYAESTSNVDPLRIKQIMTVNLISPMILIHEVLQSMIKRHQGTIVNISSVAGLTPVPGTCHYNASKAGLAAASESLRVELKSSGVQVITIYPGLISTKMEKLAKTKFKNSKSLPTGDPDILASLIHKAIIKKKPRLFYPKIYTIHRYARICNQWITNHLSKMN